MLHSGGRRTADDAILDLLAHAAHPGEYRVVTSDRALSQRCRQIGASTVHLRIDRNEICGGERPDLPELARFTETHVSLPLHPHLSDDDVAYVIDTVRAGW